MLVKTAELRVFTVSRHLIVHFFKESINLGLQCFRIRNSRLLNVFDVVSGSHGWATEMYLLCGLFTASQQEKRS
ncbi:Uncharacterised protein [Vibrio cholerae]|uniref:Uncharacterized protein n=1 Tax=Vibrio cholerae TaxID=666 RepID=A0A656ARH2_VIBCL|nr:Uncharacterised protein [Vibrio cholerae]CSD29191.1 Uncharacterised protein [Vibrio cholerae]